MQEPPLTKEGILETLAKAKTAIAEKQDTLSQTLFPFMETVSRIALAYKDQNGVKGWASNIQDAEGNRLFTDEQANNLENTVQPILQQSGGALSALNIRPSAESDLVKLPFDTSQISIDDIYYKSKEYLRAFDIQFKEMVKILGPIATLNQKPDLQIPPIMPILPMGLQIPNRLLVALLYSLLESLRLMASYGPRDMPFLRKLNSIALAVLDVLRGSWQNAILSFTGVFSRDWVLVGLIGKLFSLAYSFIGQDLQNKLEDTLFQSGKSAIIGFWLYMVSLLAPEALRMEINKLADQLKSVGQPINEQIEQVEKTAQQQVAPLGLQVKFPRVPLDAIPSIDDLQNIQTLLRNPDILCLPPVRQRIEELSKFASVRIVFELMNIPTRPLRIAETCKGKAQTVEEAVTTAIQPTVTKVGGGTRKKRRSTSSSHSRSRRLSRNSSRLSSSKRAPRTASCET